MMPPLLFYTFYFDLAEEYNPAKRGMIIDESKIKPGFSGLFRLGFPVKNGDGKMFQLSTGTVDCLGVKLNYYRTGGDLPPLVLLHGITDDGLCWTPVARELADQYDLILVDVRGHGKSEAPEQGYDPLTMAGEIGALIEGLKLQSPVVMGHSMGAMLALTLAGLFPELPRAIVLEDPPPFWMFSPGQGRNEGIYSFMEAVKRKTRDELLEWARAGNPGWSEEEINQWADSKHRFSFKIADILTQSATAPAALQAILKKISCPGLLLTADLALGAVLPEAGQAALLAQAPQLKVAHIAQAGHCIRRDQFAKFMQTVRAFLDSLD
jgi:pimeloyl-ACP methyl ester carboxylesterase